MPQTPSIITTSKESFVSSSSTATESPQHENHTQPTTTTTTTTPTPNTSTPSSICNTHLSYPPTHPSRTLYLTIRSISIFLDLSQIALAAVATAWLNHKKWMDASLSPAVSSFFWCFIDVLSVVRWHRRAHHLARAIYDAVLSIGFAIAAGFLVALAWGAINSDGNIKDARDTGVGVGLLCCMLSQVLLHAFVAYGGIRDTVDTRRAVRFQREVGVTSLA
ncbi:hypothetical protein B0H66DRAFT_555409 [Apodospora peruviana]|uniref:Uncharacterized protein n=1 Tax=Apodospora peruviana TaxID=516989 RepID=A0AAE0M8K2_9PEZI|nr:hypothetical protein B0H66DRAFT_555409 [Apodospora peruviana]